MLFQINRRTDRNNKMYSYDFLKTLILTEKVIPPGNLSRFSLKLYQKFLRYSSRSFQTIPSAVPLRELWEFLWNSSRRSSGIPPGAPRQFLQEFLLELPWELHWISSGSSLGILQGFFCNSSQSSSEIAPGVSREFLQNFLGNTSRSSSGIPS